MNDISQDEALACLKVLVAVMKADGKIDPSERTSLAGAIAGFELGDAVTVDALLDADTDVDAELAKITSAAARAQTYRSASFMVNADGRKNPAELALLDRIAVATDVSTADRASIDRVFVAQPKSKVSAFVESLGGLFRKR